MASDRTFPAKRWKAVTPGSAAIEPVPASIFVGTAGNVTAVDENGSSVVFAVQAGQIVPIQPVRITAATATGLIALYN